MLDPFGPMYYFGPLRWPRPWMWLATLGLAVVVVILNALDVPPVFLLTFLGVVAIAILVVAAPRRARELGGLGTDDERRRD